MSSSGGSRPSDLDSAIREKVSSVAVKAKNEARAAGEALSERAAEVADEQKNRLSQGLRQFAEAIERAGSELERQDQTLAGRAVREAATGLGQLSKSVGGASTGELVDSVRDFGRSNPLAFLGGAVLLGVALGRFARAEPARTLGQSAGRGEADSQVPTVSLHGGTN